MLLVKIVGHFIMSIKHDSGMGDTGAQLGGLSSNSDSSLVSGQARFLQQNNTEKHPCVLERSRFRKK